MKKMKKLFALIMAMAMVLGMSMTAMAAENTITNLSGKPSSNDKGIITVSNVEPGATVIAYRVLKAEYSSTDGSFTGYKKENNVSITDIENITKEEVNTIAKAIKGGSLPNLYSVSLVEDGEFYKTVDENDHSMATAPVGSYVIIVTPPTGSTKVYSPLYGSVAYGTTEGNNGNTLESGNIDVIASDRLYAKRQDGPVPEKNIVDDPNDDTKQSVTVGSDVTYELKATLPDYSVGYNSVVFNFVDTLSDGLTYQIDSYKVCLDGVEVPKTNVTETATGQNVTFALSDSFIRNNADKEVKITYTATVNKNAVSGLDGNTNEVILHYTNSPDTEKDSEKDTTYNYTFDISEELKKVDNQDNRILLGGAEFKLYIDEDCKTVATYKDGSVIPTAITNAEDGLIKFSKLNEGTYYLKETKAPATYQLSEKVHKIEIGASYDSDGKIENYTIKITDMDTGKKVGNSTYGGTDPTTDVTNVMNTKLSSLPSTGGIGTTIFTIGGCAIMIIAAGLFFASRRKSAK